MNSATLIHFAELAVLCAALLLSLGIASLVRRLLAHAALEARWPIVRTLAEMLRSLAFPALAMALGWLALWVAETVGGYRGFVFPVLHRSAWHLFWLAMLVFDGAESAVQQFRAASGRTQVPALLRGVVRAVVTTLAVLAVLRLELGWNITPLLASTALVTAVVGFALQGVLGNLLAGMSLNLTRAMAQRDWVAIDTIEGQVEEMNWRETWLVTREKIPVRIPNSKVADSYIRNLSRPRGPRRCSIFVDAGYSDPPDAVIQAMLASAEEVQGVLRTPAPAAHLLDFKSYGIGYELRLWVEEYHLREALMAEVRRHVWYQFRRAGIQIPYPVTDQVLNSFLERAFVPADPGARDPEARRRVAGLLRSDFARKILRRQDGTMLVSGEELSAWAAGLAGQRYGRGESVFHQGDPGDCCFVVMSGLLSGRIRHAGTGKETVFEVGPDAVVGEMSLMMGYPRSADITVKESAELLRIPAVEFAELIGKHPGVMEQLSHLVAERMQQNTRQVEDLLAAESSATDREVSKEGILKRFWHLLGRFKQ